MMREFEKWVARVLLLNSALALGVSLGLLGERQPADALPVLYGAAMLGFLSAVLSLKRWQAGLWGGLLYYALQLVAVYPLDGGRQFAVKAGVSVGLVLRFPGAVVVLNMVALALLAATAAVLAWRRRAPPA
ncbi:hypothetical protein GTP91_33015 [Rugamonas sp. FT82W]|uniref:Uncharacterized protein n=1 Tax=Duganella vulcania TaxID=2692166 RepID=A0A845GCG3_9BURK|nr:hypothetical protein [Duganella vulcania]MYM91984.1 hypothetical protein [Duganella vulcania]